MTVFGVLKKTYLFVVLRFLIICVTIAPIALIIRFYVNFLMSLFGLTATSGMVKNAFVGCFAYIGFMVGWLIFDFVRKTLLFYIKAAHVIAITKICVEDAPVQVIRNKEGEVVEEKLMIGALVGESLREMFKRFISVNIFYAADGLVLKGLSDVSKLLLTQNVMPFLKSNNIITKFLGGTVKTTLSFSDEIVLSYVFFRCRLNELYGEDDSAPKKGRKKSDSTKKKESLKEMLGYVVDGMCLYVKSCLHLMKSAFVTVLMAKIFGIITSVLAVIILFYTFRTGLLNLVIAVIILRLVYAILSYTFLEPYQTAALVSQFYEVISDDEEDVDTEEMRSKLSSVSAPFKTLADKALGKEDGESSTSAPVSGKIFEENLLDLAKKGIADSAADSDDTMKGE